MIIIIEANHLLLNKLNLEVNKFKHKNGVGIKQITKRSSNDIKLSLKD